MCLITRPLLSWGSQIIACDKVNTCRIPKGTSHVPFVIVIFAIFQVTPIDFSIFSFHAFAGTIKIIHRSGFCPQYLSLEQMSTFNNCKTIYWKKRDEDYYFSNLVDGKCSCIQWECLKSANQNAVCSVCWRIELQRFYGIFLIVRSSLLVLGKQTTTTTIIIIMIIIIITITTATTIIIKVNYN